MRKGLASVRALCLFTFFLFSQAGAASLYGRASLADLKKYGVAVRATCNGALAQHQEAFQNHIEQRLRSREVQVVPAGSVTLKLIITDIESDDGFFVVHMVLELDQSAWLPSVNKMVDAPTWDAWKMGEYREEDLLGEVDDLARQFLNDYIAAN
jgi:hypothetical protein